MELEIPFDLNAEAVTLGRCLCSVNALNSAIERLETKDFYKFEHQLIFDACKLLYAKDEAVEPFAVSAKIEETKPGKVDAPYLFGLTQFHSSDDANYFIQILKDISMKRQLMMLYKEKLALLGKQDFDPTESHAEIIKSLDQIFIGSTSKVESVFDAMNAEYRDSGKDFMGYLENQQHKFLAGQNTIAGYCSGYEKLDNQISGFNKGHYIIVGARPGVGKTTFLLNLINRFAKKRLKIGFFSLEMAVDDVIMNLVCLAAEVPTKSISRGDFGVMEYSKLHEAKKYLEKAEIYIDEQQGLKASQVCARARRWKTIYDIDILFIDYLGEIKSDQKYSNHQEAVQSVSKSIRGLAKSLKIPIVTICQLNRQNEIAKRKPSKADLRESGQIEADAHSILLLHRPDQLNPLEQPGLMQVIIAKNRFGEEGSIDFVFQKDKGVISEVGYSKKVSDDIKEFFNGSET